MGRMSPLVLLLLVLLLAAAHCLTRLHNALLPDWANLRRGLGGRQLAFSQSFRH